jgi:hypothetical protein
MFEMFCASDIVLVICHQSQTQKPPSNQSTRSETHDFPSRLLLSIVGSPQNLFNYTPCMSRAWPVCYHMNNEFNYLQAFIEFGAQACFSISIGISIDVSAKSEV